MIMIAGSGSISNYGSYVSNCRLKQKPYKVPVNGLSDVQLYINIGVTRPSTVQYELIHTCGPNASDVETLATSSYVIGQDINNNWYGVFKNLTGASGLSCFVIAITLDSQIYFSEEYCIEPSCGNLTLLKGCYGTIDSNIATDCEGLYFGVHAGSGSPMGDTSIKYEHQLLLRDVEVSLSAVKNSFKQGRTRNFRTEKEKIFQFWAEFVPEWYLSEIDAVFYRGEVYIGSTRYLLNETQFEKVEDCFRQWRPAATFKESCFQSFSCEVDPCSTAVTECCDPEIISVIVTEVPFESGFAPDSGSGAGAGGSGIVVIQGVIGGTISVTGTTDPVTGLTDGSTVISCAAFANVRVYIERGSIPIYNFIPPEGKYYTKDFGSTDIQLFGGALTNNEFIYIETIP